MFQISQDSVINVVGQHKSVRNDDTPLVENVPEDPRKSEETSREIDENNSDHEGVLVLDLSKSPEENFESPCEGEKNFDAPCAMSFAVASPNPVVTNSSHPGRNGIMLGGIIREDRELKRGSILSPISNLQTGETEINNEVIFWYKGYCTIYSYTFASENGDCKLPGPRGLMWNNFW